MVVETAGQGTDTVQSLINSYTLGADVENLIFTGVGNFTGTGNALDNVITGGALNDTLSGGGGNDTLNGGAGNDTLDGGTGNDVMIGGIGNDVYVVDSVGDVVTELPGGGTDLVQTTLASYVLGSDVEDLTFTGIGGFTGTGNALANTITGGTGADTLSGGGGNDTLVGGAGADVLEGGTGSDTLQGGADSDTATYLHAVGGIYADLGVNNAFARETSLTVGTVAVVGGASASVLSSDTLQSIENLTGSDFGDRLVGSNAANILSGGGGADILQGGGGADLLTGGSGADVFVYTALSDSTVLAAGRDTILDFTSGSDKIDLRAIDANTRLGGDQAFTFIGGGAFTGSTAMNAFQQSQHAGELHIVAGVLSGDVNGDGIADFAILLSNVNGVTPTLQAADIVL